MKRCLVLALLLVITAFVHSKYDKVEHTIVVVLENWSYDALFGTIEKANGLKNANADHYTQLDRDDKPYEHLPQVQQNVPQDLPNKPFELSPYVGMWNETVDLTHNFYTEQMQINGGKMNKFAAYGSAKGLTMSYYDYKNNYLAQLAQNYTMFDAWHHALFGGSWGNHIWLVCPNQPVFPDAPEEMINKVDKDLKLIYPDQDEVPCTPDRYAVNTIYSVNPPHPSYANISWALPLQNYTTIGDLMTEAGITWNWYAGGWNDAMAGKADPSFQFHHHPFNYFAPYAPGQPGREHLKDYDDLITAIKDNKLPQVSFYKPIGKYNMHPGYSVVGGEAEVMLRQFVETVQNSPYWEKTLIIITFDEHGGRWDHVAPPKIDRWGPGSRIPTLFVSPLVRKGYLDSTYHDSTSIMRFIQQRYGLRTLGTRDAMQKDFVQCFEGYNDMPGWVIGVISACAFIIALAIGIGIYQTVSHFVRGKREPYTTVV